MEGSKTPRKSCDLCYRRKMKCDGQKPRCSNCITYEIDCTYTAPSRKSAPKKPRNSPMVDDGINKTQDRLARLELLVQQVTERLDIAERQNEVQVPLQHEEATAITTVTPSTTTSNEDENDSPKPKVLPPLQQVLPIIQVYLQGFNSVLPLFHAETLLQLVHDCYNVEPPQRDPVSWAAINVVLVLAQRHNLEATHDAPCSDVYLRRAESVLSTVVLCDIQLLNIQVLVGMVVLLQASEDLQPALILIATTIRLAHAIGMHDRTSSEHLDPIHARQRACVFWLAYILDKDLSMRTKQPSIQVDDDIDLDLPSPTMVEYHDGVNQINTTCDASSVIATTDGTVRMNYLVARTHLAAVQGAVYDYIFSTRSRKRSPEERFRALQSVAHALEEWKASIPSEFNASGGLRGVRPGMLYFLRALHSTSLSCTTLIYQANAWHSEWIYSLRRYGSQGVEPILPPKWEVLVGEARDLLVLFGALGELERWNYWTTTGCSHMSAMILLIANNMHRPKHDNLSLDNHLVEIGLQTIDTMVKETKNERLRSFLGTCTELHQQTQRKCTEAAIMANNVDHSSQSVDT